MHGRGFRFAIVQAFILVVVALLVAHFYDLPVRDPDGVAGPTYTRFPAILLIAFLSDVVPRAMWRSRLRKDFRSTLVGIVRERWPRSHVVFMLVGLGAWYLTYAAFRSLKNDVPFVNPHLWDSTLHRLDRAMWLGHDPATVLHQIFGTGLAASFFSFIYIAWIVLIPVSLAIALVWSRNQQISEWFVTAVAVDWVLGVATYFLLPTLGPIYADTELFRRLPHTYVTTLQDSMIADRHDVLADPRATDAVQSIAAFASLHVGLMVTVCLFAELVVFPRMVRISAWIFLGLTVLATVYLGWHYFTDVLGGIVLGALGIWISALGTRNHRNGWPLLRVHEPRQDRIPQPAGQPAPPSSSAEG